MLFHGWSVKVLRVLPLSVAYGPFFHFRNNCFLEHEVLLRSQLILQVRLLSSRQLTLRLLSTLFFYAYFTEGTPSCSWQLLHASSSYLLNKICWYSNHISCAEYYILLEMCIRDRYYCLDKGLFKQRAWTLYSTCWKHRQNVTIA